MCSWLAVDAHRPPEARASGGDIRRSCDLFGMSVSAAERSTATRDHPGLTARPPGPAAL